MYNVLPAKPGTWKLEWLEATLLHMFGVLLYRWACNADTGADWRLGRVDDVQQTVSNEYRCCASSQKGCDNQTWSLLMVFAPCLLPPFNVSQSVSLHLDRPKVARKDSVANIEDANSMIIPSSVCLNQLVASYISWYFFRVRGGNVCATASHCLANLKAVSSIIPQLSSSGQVSQWRLAHHRWRILRSMSFSCIGDTPIWHPLTIPHPSFAQNQLAKKSTTATGCITLISSRRSVGHIE